MTHYGRANVKLSNSELNKLKHAKNAIDLTLKL